MEPIRFHNRYTGQIETEQVYGEGFLRWAYGNPLGRAALHAVVKRPFFSRWYGRRMSTPASARRIEPFIAAYGLDVAEFADPPESFRTFNEFFIRRLKPEARPISDSPVVFPADGRHLGFADADEIAGVFVKGQRFDLPRLLGDETLAERYRGGSLVLSRLCPTDYHRFHFPAAGTAGVARDIAGPLFSVSPLALRHRLAYLWENRRAVTEIETEALGTVAMIEIGATCVGSIVQTYSPGAVGKGDEKGYFAFGGSSIVTVFEPGAVRLADDLLANSAGQVETYAHMGDAMGGCG